MSGRLALALTVAGLWLVASAMLWWGRLPGPWRRLLAILTSAAGLGFLVLAMRTEGLRESPTMAVFLLGTPYVTGQASASASLPYYLATSVCLLLGTLGLAVRDETARDLARRWLETAIVLSLLITAVRFGLEKVAAPPVWTRAVGVTWLAPVVGAFFALNLRAEGKGLRPLVKALLLYGIAVRGAVAALMVVASTLSLGSHYDVSPLVLIRFAGSEYEFASGSFRQILLLAILPQIVVWPVYTVVVGLLGAGLALLVVPSWRRPHVLSIRPHVGLAAASED